MTSIRNVSDQVAGFRAKADASLQIIRRITSQVSKSTELVAKPQLDKPLDVFKAYKEELSKVNFIIRWIFSIEFELSHQLVLLNCDLKELLEAGVDPNLRFKDGSTLLWHACTKSNLNAVKLLLHHGADPNLKPYDKDTPYPLTIAAYLGEAQITEELLKRGAKVNAYNRYSTALLAASGSDCINGLTRKQNPEVIKVLLKYGADPFLKDKENNVCPYMYAYYLSNKDITKALPRPCDFRIQNDILQTAWRLKGV